jgi:hypothetical protein
MNITKPKTALESFERIRENAKRMPTPRDCSILQVGDVCRQGDVYILRVGAKSGIASLGAVIESRQLAPGHSNGSRHIVAESPKVAIRKASVDLAKLEKAYGIRLVDLQVGPAIEAKEEWSLTHPTHPFCNQFPADIYLTIYQIDFATKQRALD